MVACLQDATKFIYFFTFKEISPTSERDCVSPAHTTTVFKFETITN